MNRPVLIHGLLLGAAMVAAYFVWTRESTTKEDEIPILSLRGGLDRVVYSAPERTVEIERKRDGAGTYHWIKVQTEEQKPEPTPPSPPVATPDAGPASPPAKPGEKTPARGAGEPRSRAERSVQDKTATDAGAPKPDAARPRPRMIKVTKNQEFKGNQSADEMVKGMASLAAIRSLGTVEKDRLKAFGLDESKKTLSLVTGSTPRTFIIGSNTFGNRDVYLQDKQDRRVYVVRPRLLEDLQYAEFRLVDRNLYGSTPSDVEQATLVAGKQRKVLRQENRRTPASAYWAEAASPQKKKDFYRNFMGKLLRLQVMEYVLPRARTAMKTTEVLSVECQLGGGKQESMKLMESTPPMANMPANVAQKKEYFAISTNTRQLVKIDARLAEEVVREVENLMKE